MPSTKKKTCPEMGVLNSNIAGSARLVSAGLPARQAKLAGPLSPAILAQPCLKLRLLDVSLILYDSFWFRDPLRNMKASLSPFGRAPHLQVPYSYLQSIYITYFQEKVNMAAEVENIGNEGI